MSEKTYTETEVQEMFARQLADYAEVIFDLIRESSEHPLYREKRGQEALKLIAEILEGKNDYN